MNVFPMLQEIPLVANAMLGKSPLPNFSLSANHCPERVRISAFDELNRYYSDVFSSGRNEYAIQRGAMSDPEKLHQMSSFFWWTAWAASTNRPGGNVTYTQNWPHEPLIGNEPTGSTIVWSVLSFVLLLAGIGGMVWYFASQPRVEAETCCPTVIRYLVCGQHLHSVRP